MDFSTSYDGKCDVFLFHSFLSISPLRRSTVSNKTNERFTHWWLSNSFEYGICFYDKLLAFERFANDKLFEKPKFLYQRKIFTHWALMCGVGRHTDERHRSDIIFGYCQSNFSHLNLTAACTSKHTHEASNWWILWVCVHNASSTVELLRWLFKIYLITHAHTRLYACRQIGCPQ